MWIEGKKLQYCWEIRLKDFSFLQKSLLVSDAKLESLKSEKVVFVASRKLRSEEISQYRFGIVHHLFCMIYKELQDRKYNVIRVLFFLAVPVDLLVRM